jgi:hypothetical protein
VSVDCGTQIQTKNEMDPTSERGIAERVADEVVDSLMSELFDTSQLQAHD